MRTGALTRVRPPAGAGDASEPRLSADGRRIAFTSLVRSAGHERSEVFVQDLVSGRVRRASRSGEEAWEPVLSRDGRTVAYTAAREGGGSVIVIRRLGGRGVAVIAPPAGSGVAFEPSLSADGRRVAFVARAGGVRSTQVFVRDVDADGGGAQLVSRADGPGGAPAQGSAVHPVLSGDGRRSPSLPTPGTSPRRSATAPAACSSAIWRGAGRGWRAWATGPTATSARPRGRARAVTRS